MNVNEKICGFTLKEKKRVDELKAEYHRFTYDRNGADLVWLERDDDNKTFAITFKTPPEDDTGVFHILEHSVLCGSEKYPVKEPFVELIKSSLQTFLNAFTFSDKTMYPVCSRNDKDFLNLIDVYLDACLHPTSVKSELAFLQEGWHYEPDGKGGYKYNGVVFNEMKGAYASNDRVLDHALDDLLFPDNCYSRESGGHPEHIPDLTYESYVANHRRYYHPSNSRIFLDGKMDIKSVLSKIDSYLCDFDRLDVDSSIPFQKPVSPEIRREFYEISEEENGGNKFIAAQGWVAGGYDDFETNTALSVLTTALCDSNESPVKKALLDKKLCEDAELYFYDEQQQNTLRFIARNTSENKIDEVYSTLYETLKDLSENGLDRDRLHALFNRYEYKTREKDYGSYPKGLVYAIGAQDSWLYGGDPLDALCSEELFASLRKKIDEGYFEKLIKEAILNNVHTAKVILVPSKTLGSEKLEKEEKRVKKEAEKFDDDKKKEIEETFRLLREHQEKDDSPEDVAKLPKLSLDDVEKKIRPIDTSFTEAKGRKVILHSLDTDGILYANLYFDISDLPLEKYGALSLFTSLMGELATEKFTPTQLSNETDGKLGSFDVSVTVAGAKSEEDGCRPYLHVSFSMLDSKKEDAVALVDQILNKTRFDDLEYIANIIRQERIDLEQKISMAGNSFASKRALSSFSAAGALNEKMLGIDALRFLQDTDSSFEKNGKEIAASFEKMLSLFSKNTLTVSLTGEYDEKWCESVIDLFKDREVGKKQSYKIESRGNEGFVIPAAIGFAARACSLENVGEEFSGVSSVASQLLSYGYLWNTVRVKGGAYGTGMRFIYPGDYRVSSYRDPDPKRSLSDFAKVGDALREFVSSDEPIDKYIISTVADSDPLLTPRTAGAKADSRYLNGLCDGDIQKLRDEILSTDKAKLKEFADVLDRLTENSVCCAIGGKTLIEKCGFDVVESVIRADK